MTTLEREKIEYLLSGTYSTKETETLMRFIVSNDSDTTDMIYLLDIIREWNNGKSSFEDESEYNEYLDSIC